MAVFLTIFVLALTVKEDHTTLRNGCAEDSDVVTTLAAVYPGDSDENPASW